MSCDQTPLAEISSSQQMQKHIMEKFKSLKVENHL